jgi:glucokinase
MVSRVLHLLLIDILIVGLEMRHAAAPDHASTLESAGHGPASAPGIRLARPLKPYISHSQ